jgi:hypothetical protein
MTGISLELWPTSAYGHALRHAYASVAAAINVNPLLVKMLLGHSHGSDVTEGYLSRQMLKGQLRDAQSRISAEIVKRLGIKLEPARRTTDQWQPPFRVH